MASFVEGIRGDVDFFEDRTDEHCRSSTASPEAKHARDPQVEIMSKSQVYILVTSWAFPLILRTGMNFETASVGRIAAHHRTPRTLPSSEVSELE